MDAIKSITTSEEEYNTLLESDRLYIVLGKTPDDNELVVSGIYNLIDDCQYFNKLRGPANGPYTVANEKNDSKWFHGYVIGLDKAHSTDFERRFALYSIESGYGYKKIDVAEYKAQVEAALEACKNKLFASLFKEN